jgi:hypothetical protein
MSRGMRRAAKELEARRSASTVELKHAARELGERAPRVRMRAVGMPTLTVPVLEVPRRSRLPRMHRASGRRWLRGTVFVVLAGLAVAVATGAQRRAAKAPMLSGEDMGLAGRAAAAPKDGPANQMAPVPGEGGATRR